MPPPSGYRYNFGCYAVAPKKFAHTATINAGAIPVRHTNFKVFNIGRAPIYAEVIYGTAVVWYGSITGVDIQPGSHAVLNNGGRAYYITAAKIHNRGDIRAIVQCVQVNEYPFYVRKEGNFDLQIDINNLMKTIVVFGIGKIPYVGEVFSEIINFFWPEEKEDVWEQVKDKVENLIDSKTLETINGILGGEVKRFKERIMTLESELEDKVNKHDIAHHYMNIAEDLIGVEKKFIFSKSDTSKYHKINYHLLPLYSTLVMMKMTYYRLGIVNKEKVGLTDDHIIRLKSYGSRLIERDDGVIKHINQLYQTQLASEYESCHPENIFNALVTVHSYAGMNGLEYIPAWKSMLEDPYSTKKAYCDVPIYSTFFGRPTAYQARQMIMEELQPPLKPKLINGKLDKLSAILVFIWRARPGAEPLIGGLRLVYENGDYYTRGISSSEQHTIEFNGANLNKLQVWGNESLDCLKFSFSDGRVLSYGTVPRHNINQTFEMEYHHICSILVTADTTDNDPGRAVNISVTYLLTV